MLDIALKHCIYEACIDVLFDKVEHNFSNVSDRFNIGDCFFRMSTVSMEITTRAKVMYIFFDVKINYIEDRGIGITFSKYNVHFADGDSRHEPKKGYWFIAFSELHDYAKI